jgi:hypothetical protein
MVDHQVAVFRLTKRIVGIVEAGIVERTPLRQSAVIYAIGDGDICRSLDTNNWAGALPEVGSDHLHMLYPIKGLIVIETLHPHIRLGQVFKVRHSDR